MEYNPNRQSENKLKIAIAVLTILATALGFLYFRERQRNYKVEEISTSQAKELLQIACGCPFVLSEKPFNTVSLTRYQLGKWTDELSDGTLKFKNSGSSEVELSLVLCKRSQH